jgi:hypothetical protein
MFFRLTKTAIGIFSIPIMEGFVILHRGEAEVVLTTGSWWDRFPVTPGLMWTKDKTWCYDLSEWESPSRPDPRCLALLRKEGVQIPKGQYVSSTYRVIGVEKWHYLVIYGESETKFREELREIVPGRCLIVNTGRKGTRGFQVYVKDADDADLIAKSFVRPDRNVAFRHEEGPTEKITRNLNDVLVEAPFISLWVLRNFFKTGCGLYLSPEHIAHVMSLDESMSQTVFDALVDEGFIDHEGKLLQKAHSLAASSLMKPISLTKAKGLIDDVVARAAEINRDQTLRYYVAKLDLFGSVLAGKDDVADVDIAVDYQFRPGMNDYSFSAYERNPVFPRLRNHKAHVSLMEHSVIERTQADHKTIFEAGDVVKYSARRFD